MTRRKGLSAKRSRRGFTILEIIIAVGVLVALLAVGMVSVASARKRLRQQELDQKAETIYTSAQWRLVELRAAGYESLYQDSDEANGVQKLGLIPCDADETTPLTTDTLRYVESSADGTAQGSAASAVMPSGLIDEELRTNQWHIEYDPESGSVYGVFYSETGDIPEDMSELDLLRIKDKRLSYGATVGYYGGDLTQVESTDTLFPGITVENDEELRVTFYSNNPTVGEKLTFEITLTDAAGNTYKRTVEHENLDQVTTRTYRYVWTLDSLKSEASRFYEQTEHKLECGTELKITLTVRSSDAMVDAETVDRTTNSLFEHRSGVSADTAVIAYARHLQNLDEGSHVTDKITKAVQISDITFSDNANDDRDWYSLYGDTFTAIENDHLSSYDGKSDITGSEVSTAIYSLHIPNADGGDAGLFATAQGSIRNVTLTGTRIDAGTNVGALIGRADGDVTVENCRVYLSAQQGDLEGITPVKEAGDVTPWIRGTTVGGLIGRAEGAVTLESSFASVAAEGTDTAGGLIGEVAGKVSAKNVYADCYLKAPATGGLFGGTEGSADITLDSFYAVGYQTAGTAAAGITPGAVTHARDGYSACAFTLEGGQEAYSTAASGSMTNVYYLSGGTELSGSQQLQYEELTKSGTEKLGSAFTSSSGSASYPYNLMGQGLSTYSYPRLTVLDHYGDWQAEFESGALVYYEVYSDGSVGFEGANVSTLKNDSEPVGDGYALAYTEDKKPASDSEIRVTVGNGTEQTFTAGESLEVTDEKGTKYYLAALPNEITNPTLSTSSESFYQKITVNDASGEAEFYFNPYFAKTVTVNDRTPDAPSTVSIRTARQLRALSLYYAKYADETALTVYEQEQNIDYTTYEWTRYTTETAPVTAQAPIDGEVGFIATYNGGYHTIEGLSILSEVGDTGLFGTIAKSGEVRNVFLTGRVGTETITRRTTNENAVSGSRNSSQVGALAGVNHGTITNCAVSGYSMTYYGYNSNVLAIGGLVGENDGTIRACSADTAAMSLTSNRAYAYAGGFAGRNAGVITSCYSTGVIRMLDSRNSTVVIAGFVGDNSGGTTRHCYAATALTAAGDTESYGFAKIGGAVANCRYLDGGTFSYMGDLYAYNTSTNEYAEEGLAAGTKTSGEELRSVSMSGFSRASESYNHDETNPTGSFPYPAVVSGNDGTVHFGNWPVEEDIGAVGVFYWEYESYGSNSGYHFSYLGTYEDEEGEKVLRGDSLCSEHDDGGVITSYGYGYFYASSSEKKPTITSDNCSFGTENTAAGRALQAQMPGYIFVAYTTGEGSSNLHTTTFTRNATWELHYSVETEPGTTDEVTYTYSVSPFFGDAMSYDARQLTTQTEAEEKDHTEPGLLGNEYRIRSSAQLQYINWNSAQQTASYSITSANYTAQSADVKSSGYYSEYYTVRERYPYLLSGAPGSIPTKDISLYWVQSHDVDAYVENGYRNVNFTPIGSMYDSAEIRSNESSVYLAYFPYSYDGQSYIIRNIEIRTTNQCIGLFGITAGAQLQNIVMYSDRGNTIENQSGGTGWYSMGGLVGLAGSSKSSATAQTDSLFKNCTVSGYTIVDNRVAYPGWGGANIGGLVGMTNMDITNCSAVNDIEIRTSYYDTYTNIRVGGIAGGCRATINSCYAGGSIRSYITSADDTPHNSVSVWAGGIAGGIVVRSAGNLSSLVGYVDRSLTVANCYSYVDMPEAAKNSESGQYNRVRASMSIASNGEMLSAYFALVNASKVRIYNCYALKDAVSKTSDYKNCSDYQSFWGININNITSNNTDRQILVYNSSSMYVTYDEMATSMLSQLRAGASAAYDYGSSTASFTASGSFATVSDTEHGVSINGKYSYPGDDAELQGLNYPFPTVLTQKDVFGNTVNVHYGAWPKYGIYWEETSAELDLYANRKTDELTGDVMPLLELKLRVYGDTTYTLDTSSITLCDDEGIPLSEDSLPLEVHSISSYQTDAEGGYYAVTFRGLREGQVFVHAKLGEKEAETMITVKGELSFRTTETNLTLAAGEEQAVDLWFVITSEDGTEQTITPEARRLSWTVTIRSGEDAIICGNDSVTYDASTGMLHLIVKGALLDSLADEEGHVSIECTYMYGNDETERLTASADILTVTQAPDFAAFRYNGTLSGLRFWKTGDSAHRTVDSLAYELSGEGVFLRDTYMGLGGVSLGSFTLTVDGVSYTPNADGSITDTEGNLIANLTVGSGEYIGSNAYFYPVTLEGYAEESDGELTVTFGDGTSFTARIPGVPPADPGELYFISDPESVEITSTGSTVELRLYDAAGNPIIATEDRLTWSVGSDGVTVAHTTYSEETGVWTLGLQSTDTASLTDITGSVTLTCTYQYGKSAIYTRTASHTITTVTPAKPYAVLKYSGSVCGYTFESNTSATALDSSVLAVFSGDGFYTNNPDGTWADPQSYTLTWGGATCTADSSGSFTDSTGTVLATITITPHEADADGCTYYAITLTGYAQLTNATLSLTAWGQTLTLTVPAITVTPVTPTEPTEPTDPTDPTEGGSESSGDGSGESEGAEGTDGSESTESTESTDTGSGSQDAMLPDSPESGDSGESSGDGSDETNGTNETNEG